MKNLHVQKMGKLLFFFAFFFSFEVGLVCAKTILVPSVQGELQKAIDSAANGDVLEYDARTFYDGDIIINKDITIRGSGTDQKMLFARFFIRSKADGSAPKVYFENALLFNMFRATINYAIVQLDNPAYVFFNHTNVTYGGGGSEDIHDDRGVALYVTENANSSIIEATDSEFTGYLDGVRIASSTNLITFTRCQIAGQVALAIASPSAQTEKKKNNNIKLWDSTVLGYAGGDAEAAISMRGQDGLRLNLNGTKLYNGFMLNGHSALTKAHLIHFNQTNKNQNVQITIEGNSILEDTLQQIDDDGNFTASPYDGSGYVFNFGEQNLPEDNNVIEISGTVKVHPNDMEHKYNQDASYIVVGLYNQVGDGTIRTYQNPTLFTDRLTSMENDLNRLSNYRFVNWQVNYATPQDFDKNTSVSSNSDIFPKVIRLYRLSIGNDTFYIDEGKTIASLSSSDQTKLDKYREKDSSDKQFWKFVGRDGAGNEMDITEDTEIHADMNLTAKFHVQVSVLGDRTPFELELGKSLQDLESEEMERLNALRYQERKHFTFFDAVYSDTTTGVLTDDTAIFKNVTLTPKYEVWVQVGDVKIVLPENETLASVQDQEEYGSIFHPENKDFLKFQDFDLTTPVPEDMSLTALYTIRVEINGQSFTLDEGHCLFDLRSDASQKDRYLAIVSPENKIFAGFTMVDETFTEHTVLSSHLSIGATYQVSVSIQDEFRNQEFIIPEGSNLDSLQSNEAYQGLLHPGNKTFQSFVKDGRDFPTNEEIHENTTLSVRYVVTVHLGSEDFELPEKGTLRSLQGDARYQNIVERSDKDFWKFQKENEDFSIDTPIMENTTLVPLYHVTVRINDQELQLIEGEKLSSYEQTEEYLQAILQDKKVFWKLVYVSDDTDFDMDQEIHTHITLKGKYHVLVFLDEESFQIEEGQSLKDLESDDRYFLMRYPEKKSFWRFMIQEDEILETDPIFEETHIDIQYHVSVLIDDVSFQLEEGQSLSALTGVEEYDHFFKETTKDFYEFLQGAQHFDVTNPIYENTTLTASYHVTVDIDGHLFVLKEGQTIQSLQDQPDYQSIVHPKKKHFYNFYLGSEVFQDTTEIHEHTNLTAKYYILITILDHEFKMEEGSNLLTFQHDEEYQKIKQDPTKNFVGFTYQGQTITEEMPLVEDMVLTAHYMILITIDGQSYPLAEGESLQQLSAEGLEALHRLENGSDRPFAKFYFADGSEFSMDRSLTSHMTVLAEYQLKVEVDGHLFYIEKGQSLQDLSESDRQILENLRSTKKMFHHYEDQENQEITMSDSLSQDVVLHSVYHVQVIIGRDTFELVEGETLESLQSQERYQNILHHPEKDFWKFTYQGNDYDVTEAIHENIELVAVYKIHVTIQDQTYLLEEGQTLSSLPEFALEQLEEMKKEKLFSRFVNQHDRTLEMDEALHENTVVLGKYLIKITLSQEDFYLEEGSCLRDLSSEDQLRFQSLLVSSKEMSFDHLVNAKTDEVIQMDTPLWEDLVLKAIFVREEVIPSVNVPITFDQILLYLLISLLGLGGISCGMVLYTKQKHQ